MTALLASVASLDEARAVADCVGVVDLKDPRAGALGALPVAQVAAIVRDLGGRCVVSAALGEFADETAVADAAGAMAATGVDFVKIGVADAGGRRASVDRPAPGEQVDAGIRVRRSLRRQTCAANGCAVLFAFAMTSDAFGVPAMARAIDSFVAL
jgi:hypothetical protein